ncbi:zinc finger protein 143 [Microplitis demolitor]|uniref:zinc finger protein 143 n=1 Tax=Microplitis demolitor TaxID=69319 RepID=UPI00235B6B39|nr:zinc finger protein 143 [Microplitis demolitor]XP_053596048.1 zinc finger protein 143 [Microplitis demolitor]
MSLEDEETSENILCKSDDFSLLHDSNENSEDVLECLSVMVSNEESEENQVQGIILNDHPLLGATLTAITLPDGSQAYVANNLDSNDNEDTHLELKDSLEVKNTRTILIGDLSDLSEGKTLHLKLETNVDAQIKPGSSSQDDIYSGVEIIDGATTYMVTSNTDNQLWEITGDKCTNSSDDINKIYVKKITSSTRSQYPCPRDGCGKVYTTLHHLKVHERSHTGQKPYECTFSNCDKSFSTGYSLKAHLRTHTGEKPYKCNSESCNKSFKTSGDLLKHVRTHTGERPFVCPYEGCGRSFTTSNIRKVHVRTHTGERPYQCSTCNKAFASATNYKNHVRIHSGEKPYACSMENCDKRFTEYSSLYKHHLVHTQQKPFECKLCFKRYRQNSTLVMHKRTAHALVGEGDAEDYVDNDGEAEGEGDDEGIDGIFNDNCDDSLNNEHRDVKNVIDVNEQLQIEGNKNSSDSGTQILFVGDPTQIAVLQQMGLEEGFNETEMDPSLEGLNIKIEDMEFGWN